MKVRKKLKSIDRTRKRFSGTFEKFGIKNGHSWQETTVLLVDIRDDNDKYMTNHLWFNFTKRFQLLELSGGEKLEFDARVKKYKKGKRSKEDFKLTYPTKIEIISK